MAPFWHRKPYFSILNLSVFHLADKHFTVSNLINLRTILFLEYRKTPETLRFRGILRLDTMLSCDNDIYNFIMLISDYSMIVATRPDPTVRPPSRIAKVRPCSIAIGWISSIVISTLSPGMHISVPSGRLHNTCYVSCSEVELRTIVVEERSMTSTFIFCQNVNLSCEFCDGMLQNLV